MIYKLDSRPKCRFYKILLLFSKYNFIKLLNYRSIKDFKAKTHYINT